MQEAGKIIDNPKAARRYDLISGSIILLFLILLFRIRDHLPVTLDSWYHLGVIRAFSERGVSLHAWWEDAPFGRPHLYSPLLHLLYLAIFRLTNCSLVDVARVYDVVTFPLVLFAGWWASRLLYGPRAALLTLLLLALNIGLLFPCSLIMMPGTYAMILWPFLHLFILRKNPAAAGVILAVMCYFHFAVASVAILSLVILICFRREYWKAALAAVALAAILFTPWLTHLVANRQFLHTGISTVPAFIPILSVLAAILGAVGVAKYRDKEALAILCIILACSIFLYALQERFWTYGGFTFAILGGYGIDRCLKNHIRWAILVLVVFGVVLTPFLKRWPTRLGLPIAFQDVHLILATPLYTLAQWQTVEKQSEIRPAVPDDIGELADWILKNVASDDVLMTDDMHLGAYLYALTGRRSTTALWDEVTTTELTHKLADYYENSPGFLIYTSIAKDAERVPSKATLVATFGRFRVYQRRA